MPMQRSVLGKLGIAAGVAAAATVLSLSGAGAASADITPRHGLTYPTYTDCVYAGNFYAQMGGLHGFSCPQVSNGEYLLDWW
ncbi:hypothetical protein [Actinoallomurus rhizosphaericola]|uniref:hypothetical protein n=1 Tax=Actinoallomurus rhizosphaericola TaxID=2952536 RepID=UPI0020907664|nr:hypothetical protein [Actinoallomurus rhizosphaericola]MCO5992389.1 hypothetical protein [Actinoallomurus rhizosphaericola]